MMANDSFVLGVSLLGQTRIGGVILNDYYNQMMDYYPEVIKSIREFQYLIETQSIEVDEVREKLDGVLNNAFIVTADEDRIGMWEKFLGITVLPQEENEEYEDWLNSRRNTILARLYQSEKLNTKFIEDIVSIFTNNISESWIIDGTLYVKVYPTDESNKIVNLNNIRNELEIKRPAHLELTVYQNYAVWNTINSRFSTWGDIGKEIDTWKGVKFCSDDSFLDVYEYIVDEDGNSIMDESNNRLFN